MFPLSTSFVQAVLVSDWCVFFLAGAPLFDACTIIHHLVALELCHLFNLVPTLLVTIIGCRLGGWSNKIQPAVLPFWLHHTVFEAQICNGNAALKNNAVL